MAITLRLATTPSPSFNLLPLPSLAGDPKVSRHQGHADSFGSYSPLLRAMQERWQHICLDIPFFFRAESRKDFRSFAVYPYQIYPMTFRRILICSSMHQSSAMSRYGTAAAEIPSFLPTPSHASHWKIFPSANVTTPSKSRTLYVQVISSSSLTQLPRCHWNRWKLTGS